MSYATKQDLKNRLGRHFDSLYDVLTDDIVNSDLASAQAEIDANIQSRYLLPITDESTIVLLRSFELTLCEELAWSRVAPDNVPGSLVVRVKTVRESLRRISDGVMKLSAIELHETNAATAVFTKSDDPIFTATNMSKF